MIEESIKWGRDRKREREMRSRDVEYGSVRYEA